MTAAPANIHALSEEEKEGLYAFAFDAYTCGNYEEGVKVFKHLIAVASLTPKYWKGLASCLQQSGNLEEAISSWAMVVLLDENDAMAHFHAAQCLTAIGNKEDALKAIILAEEMTSFDKELQNNLQQLRNML
ncbi:MAG: tetratricopeptide repeat protein [Rhabdochlamydiaceae bacterium]|jgi:type III secretion system low calcium response chaperone LcrH/SycD